MISKIRHALNFLFRDVSSLLPNSEISNPNQRRTFLSSLLGSALGVTILSRPAIAEDDPFAKMDQIADQIKYSSSNYPNSISLLWTVFLHLRNPHTFVLTNLKKEKLIKEVVVCYSSSLICSVFRN